MGRRGGGRVRLSEPIRARNTQEERATHGRRKELWSRSGILMPWRLLMTMCAGRTMTTRYGPSLTTGASLSPPCYYQEGRGCTTFKSFYKHCLLPQLARAFHKRMAKMIIHIPDGMDVSYTPEVPSFETHEFVDYLQQGRQADPQAPDYLHCLGGHRPYPPCRHTARDELEP